MTDNNSNNSGGNGLDPDTRTFIQDCFNQMGQQLNAQPNGTPPDLASHFDALKDLRKKISELEAKQKESKEQKAIEDFSSAKSFNLATNKAKVVQIMESNRFVKTSIACAETVRNYLVNDLPSDVDIPDDVVDAVNLLLTHNSTFLEKQEFFKQVYTITDRVYKPADLASEKRSQISSSAVSLWRLHKDNWKAKKNDCIEEISRAVDRACRELHEERSCRSISSLKSERTSYASKTPADKEDKIPRKRGARGGKKKGNNKRNKKDDASGLSVTFDTEPALAIED